MGGFQIIKRPAKSDFLSDLTGRFETSEWRPHLDQSVRVRHDRDYPALGPFRMPHRTHNVLLWDGSAIQATPIARNRLKLALLPQSVPFDDLPAALIIVPPTTKSTNR